MEIAVTVASVSDKEIYGVLAPAIARAVTKGLNMMATPLKKRVGDHVIGLIENAPEANALRGPTRFHGEVGVEDSATVVHVVAQAVARTVDVRVIPVLVSGQGVVTQGGVEVGILTREMKEVLSLPEAEFVSKNRHRVPWLRWLLTAGTANLVDEYAFVFAPNTPGDFSRTGLGYMKRLKSRRGWGLTEFAGTDGDNWLTRALGDAGRAVEVIVGEELGRVF